MPLIGVPTTTLYYETHGKGQPVLFVSGLGGDHNDWNWQLPSHAAEFQCILFDNRLVGKSRDEKAAAASSPYTIEALATDMANLLEALQIARAHVVSSSMGGAIAQMFALKYPRKALSLSLHSTIARTGELFRAKLQAQVELLKKLEVHELLFSLAPWIWSEETLRDRPATIESFRAFRKACGLAVSKEVYRMQAIALMEFDVAARLCEIAVPVLVTAGADDILIPPSESRRIHDAIAGSEFQVFPGCGHASLVEKPEQFNAVSLGFLRAAGRTA
jgi:pimeloyl-ACP methyl ester carboxylesterase